MKKKIIIEAWYDPDKDDYDQAIDRALAAAGMKDGDATVLCRPKKAVAGPVQKSLFDIT